MESYFILIPSFVYWCIDEKKGMGLSAAVLLSIWIVFFLEYYKVLLPFGFVLSLIIASVIFLVYFLFAKKIEPLFAKGGFRAGMIISAVVSFLMIMRLPNDKFLVPGGILLGVGAGYCLNWRYIGFKSRLLTESASASAQGIIVKCLVMLVRFLLGSTGFMLILAATGRLIPQDSGNINLYNFIRYALSGLWVSAASPWIFIRLRLAGKSITGDAGPEERE
ncbi:MAG: hypothetical protein FWC03_04305 [Treponema sp.]|nr:hypothetical protein [Treponema sp.]